MKNSLAITPSWGSSINTLAQSGTKAKSKIIPLPGMVHGVGADISNVKQMQRWAEEKYIMAHLVRKLADTAKSRGDFERSDSYWNCFYCAKRVITGDGRLHTFYCKTRVCALCNGIRKAEKIHSFLPIVQSWPDPFSMVLTVKSISAEGLKKRIDEMYSLIRRIVQKYRKRSQRGAKLRLKGIRVFECTYNPVTREYHPHFHFIVADRVIADTLRNEWITEGQELWGKDAVYQGSQVFNRIENNEEALERIIKYGTKIFTETNPRNKKSKKAVYIQALDTIISEMKGRRIFDRFGFNLPKQPPREKIVKHLENYKEWVFVSKEADWLEKDGSLTLANYTVTPDIKNFLKESIVDEIRCLKRIWKGQHFIERIE